MPTPVFETAIRTPTATSGEQSTIGKGLLIKGEISGTESLYVDGKVEGSINLPGNRVTIGRWFGDQRCADDRCQPVADKK